MYLIFSLEELHFFFFFFWICVVGAMRKFGRNLPSIPQTKVVRTISVKDVISVLEREPQMSKSTLMYRLYERAAADAVVE